MREQEKPTQTSDDGTYVVQTSHVFNIVTIFLSVLAAILLWMYSVSAQTETGLQLDVLAKNGTSFGYMDGEVVGTVNLTISGRVLDLRDLDKDQIVAYVDMQDVKNDGTAHNFSVMICLPDGTSDKLVSYKFSGSGSLSLQPRS